MQLARKHWFSLLLVPLALAWPLGRAASWRPQRFCTLPGAVRVQLSPRATFLIVGSADANRNAQIWRVATQKLVREVPNLSAEFSPDEKTVSVFNSRFVSTGLATGSSYYSHWKRIVNIESGKSQVVSLPKSPVASLLRAPKAVKPTSNSQFATTKLRANFAADGVVTISTLSSNQALWKVPVAESFCGFSGDGNEAFVLDGVSGLSVRDARTGKETRRLPGPSSQMFAATSDGNWLFEAREDAVWKWRAR